MARTGREYIHGTAAEKLEYDVYEENKVLKQKKKTKQNNKAKVKIVFSMLLVFAFCFIIVYRYAQITQLNYGIIKENKILENMKNENYKLKVDIEKNTDLFRIRKVAEERLSMQDPDKSQIVYVNVPKSDYTKVAVNAGSDTHTISSLIRKIDSLVSLLY